MDENCRRCMSGRKEQTPIVRGRHKSTEKGGKRREQFTGMQRRDSKHPGRGPEKVW